MAMSGRGEVIDMWGVCGGIFIYIGSDWEFERLENEQFLAGTSEEAPAVFLAYYRSS